MKINESQLRKIIQESVNTVLKEIVADDGYSFDGLEDYEAQQEYYRNNYSIDYVINNLKQIGFDIPTINGEFPYNIINTVKTLLGLIAGAEKEEINKGKMYEILHNYTLKYMENYQKRCQEVIQEFNYLDYRLEKLCKKYPLSQEDTEQYNRDFDD